MLSRYCAPVILLVVLTNSAVRNLKDVNPETHPIYAQAMDTD